MLTWLALAALLVQDPTGDAHGAGDLIPPQAPAYASVAPFDLVEVGVSDTVPVEVRIELADVVDAASLPVGITLPVIDVYLGDGGAGERATSLPGPDLRFPPGRGWTWAVRVHGDGAVAVRGRDGLRVEVPAERRGPAVVVTLPRAATPPFRRVQAVTGVYDPFGEDAWRAFRSEASPWTFASPRPVPPVVDLLAPDGEAQAAAVNAATFPRTGVDLARWVWPLVAAGGAALAVLATVQRWRAGRARRAASGIEVLDLIEEADLVARPPVEPPARRSPPSSGGAGGAAAPASAEPGGPDATGAGDREDGGDGDVVRSVVRLDTPPSRHG
jgi:carbohydrate-binding DOMON domain-containing protein